MHSLLQTATPPEEQGRGGRRAGPEEGQPPEWLRFGSIHHTQQAWRAAWNRNRILSARRKKERYLGWLHDTRRALVEAEVGDDAKE